jgi:hypothetical protein
MRVFIIKLSNRFCHKFNSMDSANKALNEAKINPLTKTVKEADTVRDDLYIALRDHVTAGIRRRKNDYRDACLELYPIFEQNNSCCTILAIMRRLLPSKAL